MIGLTLGHYRIEAELGAGGMGVVYRARDTRLERSVALKFVGEQRTAEAGARLVREARAASSLNHPHICHIYEVGEAEGRAYIAMELVEGRPLSALVPAEGLPVESVLRYGEQVADALAHAHERGIVHRDLKSANVVITPEGRAKVLDFGLAQRLQPEQLAEATRSRASLTGEHTLAGTLHYIAPELLRGEPADARSDLWALGVLLYEMAAGKLPFEGQTGFELSSQILREPPAPLPARVPAGLRAIIQRLLAKEPGQRYQRAGEVRAALEALQSDTAIAAVPASRALVRRWWFWAVATPLLLIGLGVVIAAIRGVPFSIGYTKIEKPEGPAEPRLSGSHLRRTGGKPSANPEANEYFQKGTLFLDTQFNVPRAHQMLERALELDPHFGKARAIYGLTYVLMIEGGYSNDPALLYKAEEEARRALQDDPSVSYGRIVLAGVYLLQGRKELVAGELDRALQGEQDPLPATMWWLLYHKFNGDYGRAEELAKEMLVADPMFFPPRTYLGEMLREQGKLAEAIREQEKVLEQDPTNILALRHLSRAYLDLGDLRRARATLERARPEDRQNYRLRLGLALLLAREGRRAEALKEMDSEVEKYAGVHVSMNGEAAAFYAVLGDKETAVEWLERAVRNGDERGVWFQRDPLLASIRNEARFKQILDSIAYRRQQRSQAAAQP